MKARAIMEKILFKLTLIVDFELQFPTTSQNINQDKNNETIPQIDRIYDNSIWIEPIKKIHYYYIDEED